MGGTLTRLRLAREAMATRFEIVLWGENLRSLQAIGEEALDEVSRVEARLSLYRSTSQITRANHLASRTPVRLEASVFDLVVRCRRWTRITEGAFDITLGPLSRCWGFTGAGGRVPDREARERARERVGMHLVRLDPGDRTVAFLREGVMLDFGSLGKGHALERAREILEWHGVRSALLHGGTSTVATLGAPPDEDAWKVAIAAPRDPRAEAPSGIAALRGQSLSVSAGRGKSFREAGREYGHVLDARTGEPAREALIAAVQRDCPTEADALSTALLVAGAFGREWMEREYPGSPYLFSTGTRGAIENRGFAAPDTLRDSGPGPRPRSG